MNGLVRQRGLSMFGFLIVAVIVVFMALLTMRLVPAYLEFFTIKKILLDIGNNPNISSMGNSEIREIFTKRAQVDNIDTVRASDLEIGRQSGISVVSVEYTYQTPLIANISLLVEFKANSSGNKLATQTLE